MSSSTDTISSSIILTGIKPTGMPHIGNYLGAIKPALDLSIRHPDSTAFYFIADYHAITTLKDANLIREYTYQVAATWLALGLDPKKVVFYKQSDIPEIFELAWVLSCFSPKGLLNRAHAYKTIVDDNTQHQRDPDKGINMGLFSYPVLMAADIILFNCQRVPVGQDQKQHVEIARDIAQTFNQTYGDVLVVPEPDIQENVMTIPGLDGQKMSKNYNNTVPLFLDEKPLRKKIMQIKTDSTPVEDPKDPSKCNVFSLYKLFANETDINRLKDRYETGGMGYGDAKQTLFECIRDQFADAKYRYDQLMAQPAQIDEILKQGAQSARQIAAKNLAAIRKAIGISH